MYNHKVYIKYYHVGDEILYEEYEDRMAMFEWLRTTKAPYDVPPQHLTPKSKYYEMRFKNPNDRLIFLLKFGGRCVRHNPL